LADLALTFRVRVGGVLTNATSVVLSNVAGTAGVTRDDTSAVVVADNTPMVNTATGVYQHTIANAVAGVTYRYHVECLLNGTIYRDEDTASIAVASTLPSYLTLSEAESLAGAMALKVWSAKTSTEKMNALAMASMRIDAAMRYQGGKYEPDQSLEFPRIDGSRATTATGWRDSPGDDLIIAPNDCLHACILEADSLLLGDRDGRLQKLADGLTAQSIGSASESYGPADGNTVRPVLCFGANVLMQKYRLMSGGIV
jgi:hypothetical protein